MGHIVDLPVSLSHSQLCVFDPDLPEPFNDWTPQHLAQGFSWRPGSVSFATTFDSGTCACAVETGSTEPVLSDALLAIAVPFSVPAHCRAEIGSVTGGTIVTVPAGAYRLIFMDQGEASARFRIVFISDGECEPSVLRGFGDIQPKGSYLMDAQPA